MSEFLTQQAIVHSPDISIVTGVTDALLKTRLAYAPIVIQLKSPAYALHMPHIRALRRKITHYSLKETPENRYHLKIDEYLSV